MSRQAASGGSSTGIELFVDGGQEGKTAVVTGGTPRQRLEVIEAIHLPGKPLRGANAGFGGARIPLATEPPISLKLSMSPQNQPICPLECAAGVPRPDSGRGIPPSSLALDAITPTPKMRAVGPIK